MVEVLIAVFAAFLAVSIAIGFFRNDRFAGEWGALLVPLELIIAGAFGWAGYVLLRRGNAGWKHQLVPVIAVGLIAAYAIWADSI